MSLVFIAVGAALLTLLALNTVLQDPPRASPARSRRVRTAVVAEPHRSRQARP